MAKRFRASEQGFYDGQLIQPGVTFDAHDEFDPNWAVEVEGHDANAYNSGEQESLPQNVTPVLPTLARADAPLADFHPQLAVPTAESETVDAIDATDTGDGTPVVRTSETTSTSDPAKAAPASRKRPGANTIDTGTAPSEGEKADAHAASDSEVEAQKSLI